MRYQINAPQKVTGEIKLPASKSISNRVLIINALSYSDHAVSNVADCDDTNVMLKALESDDCNFDIGAAGTSMRFLTAFLSKIVGEWTITGTERMKNRPIRILVDALNKLGAKIEYMEKDGYPPLRIYGSALQGGDLSLDGSVSSQYISALLMVAPTMENGLNLTLEGNVISKPYINLTLRLLEEFGIKSSWVGNTIKIKPQEFIPKPFTVESDWSAASYWYQIAALSKDFDIELLGLYKNSYQGDSKLTEVFNKLGIVTKYTDKGVRLLKGEVVTKKLVNNFVDQPDLAQTFVVTCCLMGIPFYFSGLQTLKIKETDRILALKNEMKKLGYLITDKNDSILEWNGERCEPEAEPVIATYEDHRMAMAFAPAALKMEHITIAEPQVVSKSYPQYWEHLVSVGFGIE
ncbi:3-phosphoshikimate 1-carboxyvinyltransferase [Parabacteroides sp. FAFU027]|uniref:3-phosphoshikimate 1-carboxyvinyltransferase n=1 Tax=Parabacteroides sp. FAFU027 TaxID=2922715 RepID=UPI001FAF8CB3|nr:3-phosphoshikimate 1-carboxyvinyltransferase [Parabacteroides sp. FAFU027]